MFEKIRINKILGNITEAIDKENLASLYQDIKGFEEQGLEIVCEAIKNNDLNHTKAHDLMEVLFDTAHLQYFLHPLSSTNGKIRQATREVLERHLSSINSADLISSMQDSTFYARKNISDLILIKNDPKVAQGAINLYRETKDDALKKSILPIFEKFPNPQIKDFLLKLNKKCSYWERGYAINLLKSYNDPQVAQVLEEMLDEKDVSLLKNVVDSLGMMKVHSSARKIVPLLESDDLLLRQKAVEALQQLKNPTIVPDIMNLLKSSNVNTRRCVAEVLNSFNDEQSITALIKALEDDDWWVREIATEALSQNGSNMIPDMLKKLLHVKNIKVRQCASSFFSKISAPYVLKDLIRLLDDEEWMIRENAVKGLALINDERALPYLVKKVGDHDIKRSLPNYISQFKREHAVWGIAKLLETGDDDVLLACLKVITKNTYDELVPILKKVGQNAKFEVHDQVSNTIRALTGDVKTINNDPNWR